MDINLIRNDSLDRVIYLDVVQAVKEQTRFGRVGTSIFWTIADGTCMRSDLDVSAAWTVPYVCDYLDQKTREGAAAIRVLEYIKPYLLFIHSATIEVDPPDESVQVGDGLGYLPPATVKATETRSSYLTPGHLQQVATKIAEEWLFQSVQTRLS